MTLEETFESSPDGTQIVTTRRLGSAGAAWVWDAENLAPSMDTPLAIAESLPHDGFLERAEFSPDGTRLLTAVTTLFGDGSEVLVWDVNGRGRLIPLATLPVPGLKWAEFSADGSRIVTAGNDIAQLWDATGTDTLTPLGTFSHPYPINSAGLSPDGELIVTSGNEHGAAVWDVDDAAEPLATLEHPGSMSWAEFSPDGSRIVTASDNGTALVWIVEDGAVGFDPPPPAMLEHGEPLVSAAFSDDGTRILTISDFTGEFVRVWDVEHLVGRPEQPMGTLLATLEQQSSVATAEFDRSGTRIVTATGSARVWDADGPLLVRLDHDGTDVREAEFSPDGDQVVALGPEFGDGELTPERNVILWASDGPLVAQLQHGGEVRSAHFSPDGDRLLVASATWLYDENAVSTIQVWDAGDASAPLAKFEADDEQLTSALFSPDGERIVAASNTMTDGVVRVFDSDLSPDTFSEFRFDAQVVSAQFNPDRVIVMPFQGLAEVWDLEGKRLATLQDGRVGVADFNGDGSVLVTARFRTTDDEGSSADTGLVQVWDLDGSEAPLSPRAVLPHGADLDVTSVSFSPDDALIVTATSGEGGQFTPTGVARVWDATDTGTLTPLATLPHDGDITAAFFSNDGTRIVTASDDQTVRVWRLDGTLLATLPHEGALSSAAFDSGDNRIVTSATNSASVDLPAAAVLVWESFDIEGLLAAAEHRIGVRQFTDAECVRFSIASCLS